MAQGAMRIFATKLLSEGTVKRKRSVIDPHHRQGPDNSKMKSKELKIIRKKLEKANRIEDPLQGLEKQLEQISDGENDKKLSLRYSSSSDMSDKEIRDCLTLFERNMGELYRKSSWGLDMRTKESEFRHRRARFLVVRTTDENREEDLVAFVHFRFDLDDDESPSMPVLYLFEIQIDSSYRRRGLGKQLMALLESICSKAALPKVMLTTFKSNKSAMRFYTEALDYAVDDISPSKHGVFADYEILSKEIASS